MDSSDGYALIFTKITH